MVLRWWFRLGIGRATYESGQEIIVGMVVSNPLGGRRCTRSTGRVFTDNRGRKWKIGVVDLRILLACEMCIPHGRGDRCHP